MSARDEIFALCDRLGAAHEARDADAILACFAEDAVIYDLAPPLASRGMGRERLTEWLATWDGPIRFEARDVAVTFEGDLGVMTGLNRIIGVQGGVTQDMWFRVTTIFRRSDAGWRIVHDHASVPFHMDGSHRAAVELQP